MIQGKYLAEIKGISGKYLKEGDRAFIFGSSAEDKKFNDIDLAVVSDRDDLDKALMQIRDDLEESKLPYKFDVVNFNQAKESFRNRVMNGPKIWII